MFSMPNGIRTTKPEEFSNGLAEQQVEERFDTWTSAWRGTFSQFAMMALDLPNYSDDRNATHW